MGDFMEEKAYLLVHYKSPNARIEEQVHFAVSRDGYQWEAVNGGAPVFIAVSYTHLNYSLF